MTQPQMAERLKIAQRTYAGYERGERELGALSMRLLMEMGWSANWLLTGEGRERIDVTADASQAVDAAEPSHEARLEAMKLAVELLDGELARARKVLAPEKRAEAYLLLTDLLLEPGELPSAKVVQLAIKAVA